MSPPRLGRSNRRLQTHKSLLHWNVSDYEPGSRWFSNLAKSSEQPQSPGALGNYFRREYTEENVGLGPGCFTATLPAHVGGSTILS
jgi:hypothetical protein